MGCWLAISWMVGCGCEPPGASDTTRFNTMEQTDLTVGDATLRVWVAKTDNDRAAGFMYVEPEQLATLPDDADPGMLFIFPADQPATHGFWMKNVPVPLDIAFLDSSGKILTVSTMAAFDHRQTQSEGSYRYAIEVRGGLYGELGVTEGLTVAIPESVLNNVQ